jgi:acetyl esterase
MPVDAQVQLILDLINSLDLPPLAEQAPAEVRAAYSAQAAMAPVVQDVAIVRDLTLPGAAGEVGARLYHPGGEPPLIVFFHGGGWVIGDLETHDGLCRSLADRADAAVLAVDYRLAPEHPFPAAVDDAMAAARWAAANAADLGADPTRVAVAGDSAGGNLAAIVAQELRGEVDLAAQILLYPVVDCDFDRPSYKENAEGYFLTREAMEWFFGHYVPDFGSRAHPKVSPLRNDDLSGLPPAVVVTAGFDPLRDEGDAYAEALADAGVEVRHLRYPDQIHGFVGFIGLVEAAGRALDDVVDSVRPWLEPSGS